MAYGLDVTDLIYTNADLEDIGTLDDHEIDLDIAGEKNFELRSDTHIMENGSLWYVDGTEFGGLVGKFETDPDTYKVIYTGRGFRGIQASKIIEVPEGLNVVRYSGAISAVVNQILEEYDLDGFFVCDVPTMNDDLDIVPVVGDVDILSGTTVYDAIMKIAESIGFSFLYEYSAREKMCHMIPIVSQDWIELMAYNRDNTAKFKSSLNGDFTNHLICSGIDENGHRRTIHLYLDGNGVLQPYSIVDKPLKDDDYILDKSKKVLSGIREISDYYEGQISVENNYELLEEQPDDWTLFFGNYYKRIKKESIGSYEPKKIQDGRHVTFEKYVTIDSLDITQGAGELMTHLTPETDWYLYQPETITTFSFMEDYRNWLVKIGEVEYLVDKEAKVEIPTADVPDNVVVTSDAKIALFGYSSDELELNYDYWIGEPVTRSKTIEFSSTYGVGENVSIATRSVEDDTYEQVTAEEVVTYNSKTITTSDDWYNNYSYYYTRKWDDSKQEWTYSNYASTTRINTANMIRVTSRPSDWSYNYGQYYYKFYNGITYEPIAYSGKSRDVYKLLRGRPDDWYSNFSSYYIKAYEVTYKKKSKTSTKIVYSKSAIKKVSGYKSSVEKYVSVPEKKKKKGQKNYHRWPDWVANAYYSKESVTDPPAFNARNCYLPTTEIVRPSYEPGNCFEKVVTAKAPDFTEKDQDGNGIYYRMVQDHYANLVRNGVDVLTKQTVGDSYEVTVDDYDFNIGDVVGGEDEVTGLNVPQKVTNKIIKITRGVVYVDYEIGG